MMSAKYRVIFLMVVVVVVALLVLTLSVGLLPDAPISPTATYPEGIDLPDGRDVPSR